MLQNEEVKMNYEASVYKEQLRLLQGEIDRVMLSLLDLENASRTVENLESKDSIVPIGGGAFIKANIYSTYVIVPIGAGYLVEMDKEVSAIELKKRTESTKKAIEKLKEEFVKISKKIQEISIKLRDVRAASAIDKRVEESAHSEYV